MSEIFTDLVADSIPSEKCHDFQFLPIPFRGTLPLPDRYLSHFDVLAGGYFFIHPSLQGRSIVWRIKGENRVVELVEQHLLSESPHHTTAFAPAGLQISFSDDEIAPPVLVTETAEYLRVIVITRRRALHWFNFALSSFLPASSNAAARPVIAQFSPQLISDVSLRYQPYCHALRSPNSILLGCEGGVIIEQSLAEHQRPAPRILNERSLIGKLFSWRENPFPLRIISIAALSPFHIVALSADGSIALWDLQARIRILQQSISSDHLLPQTFRVASQSPSPSPHDDDDDDDDDNDPDDDDPDEYLTNAVLIVYARSSDSRTHNFVLFHLADPDDDGWQLLPLLTIGAPRPLITPAQYLLDYAFTPDGFLWSLWMNQQYDSADLLRIPCDPFALLPHPILPQQSAWRPALMLTSPLPSLPFPPNTSLDPHRDACQLLSSPVFSLSTLRDTLLALVERLDPGFQLDPHLAAFTREQLRRTFVSFCEHNSSPDASHQQQLLLWQQVIASCHETWLRDHTPIALLPAYPFTLSSLATAMILVKQSGVSLVRTTFPEEAWLWCRRPTAPSAPCFNLPQPVQSVLAALRLLATHLSPDTLAIFTDISADPLSVCYPVITALITGTFPTSDVNQAIESESFPLPSPSTKSPFVLEFVQILLPLINVSALLPTLSDMLALLAQEAPPANLLTSRTPHFPTDVLASTTLCLLDARFQLARDLLLLLCLVSHLRSVIPLSAAELNALQRHTLHRCTTLFKSLRLMQWVFHRSTTPMPGLSAPEDRPTVWIVDRPKAAPAPVNFLESLLAQQPVGSLSLRSAVYQVLHQFDLADEGAFLTVCDQLRRRRDLATLDQMIRAAPLDSPALNFLRALHHLAKGQFEKAHACFLKVAVYFSSIEMPTDFQHDASLRYLSYITEEILSEAHEFAAPSHSPSFWLVRFFLSILVLYTQQKAPAAYYHQIAALAVNASTDRALKEAIWVRTFRRWLEAADFQAAYEIVLEFFDLDQAAGDEPASASQSQMDCLRLLVISMCEQGKVSAFMALPLFGPLIDVADLILQRKAEHSDIVHRPNYYQILYAFRTLHADYRKAGLAMWRLADRLAAEANPNDHQLQTLRINALAAATASWSLIASENNYVVSRPLPHLTGPSTAREKYAVAPADADAFHEELCSDEEDQGWEAVDDDHHPIDDTVRALAANFGSAEVQVLSGADSEKQYLLGYVLHHLASHGKLPTKDPRYLKLAELLAPLLKIGSLNLAISLCQRFSLSLTPLFSMLTQEWLRLRPRDPLSPPPPAAMDANALIDLLVIRGYDGRREPQSFDQLLLELLITYDSRTTNYEYMKVVAQAILLAQPQLPPWLLDLFIERQQYDVLLDIYYDFHLVDQSVQCLERLLTPLFTNPIPTIIPRTQINRLIQFMKENDLPQLATIESLLNH